MYMAIISRISLIIGVNRASMSWVICPWISKNAINHFVYTLAPCLHSSTFISSPILIIFIQNDYYYTKMDEFNFEGIVKYRTRVTGPWFYENCVILPCLHSSICKFKAIFLKHCNNVCGHKILDEFDYELYPTSMSLVICP